MYILVVTLVLLVLYLSLNTIKVVHRNYRAHKFFQIKSPQLPVVPDPNIFVGNMDQTIWTMKTCHQIDRLHDKFGKTFGYYVADQAWVSTKDIDLIKRIEIDDAHKHIDKAKIIWLIHEFNNTIFLVNGDQWRRVRQAIAPSMTNMRVRSDAVSSDIEQVTGQFVRAVERKLDQAEKSTNKRSIILDVHNYAQRMTLAIIFLITYRKQNVIDFDIDDEYWVKEFNEAELKFLHWGQKMAWALPFLLWFGEWAVKFHRIGRLHARIVEYIHQTIESHRAARQRHYKLQGTDKSFSDSSSSPEYKRRMIDGFIDMLVEKKINLDQFVSNAHFLLLAGFDSTANTMSCLLWHLANNPDIQTKLRGTIINEGIDADYVVWCLLETIRWHPPVPLGTGRVISEDITTQDGLLIPKGTFVMPSTYSIHHDESIWPEHHKFMPERWRDQSKFHPAAFMGFGLGPRNCVGRKLAAHELKLMIEAIIPRYKVEKCEDTPDEYNFSCPGMIYTIPDKPVMLKFTPVDIKN